MIGFEYIYNTPSEILKEILVFSEAGYIEYSIIAGIFFVFLLFIYYIIPYFRVMWGQMVADKKKREKRDFINRIAMQKNIEEEIEKELDI